MKPGTVEEPIVGVSMNFSYESVGTRVDARVLGLAAEETWLVPHTPLSIQCGRDYFYEPRFIMVKASENGEWYDIYPEAFVTARDLELSIATDLTDPRTGLCWWDTEESRWVWISEGPPVDGVVSGPTQGGGRFAVQVDSIAPEVRNLNVRNGATLKSSWPIIRFELEDNLSGIKDDESIDVRIDGRWLIPEYDTDKFVLKADLRGRLQPGEHTLAISVTDRAGNTTELERQFFVK